MRMRTKVIVPVMALVLVVGVAASALAASGNKATGGVKQPTGDGNEAQRAFTAQGSPTSAKGQIQQKLVDPSGNLVRQFHGVVDCYFQEGNRARFSGVITKSRGEDVEGQFFIYAVEDNGEGANAPVDRIAARRSVVPFDCQLPVVQPTQPVTSGNIQVHE